MSCTGLEQDLTRWLHCALDTRPSLRAAAMSGLADVLIVVTAKFRRPDTLVRSPFVRDGAEVSRQTRPHGMERTVMTVGTDVAHFTQRSDHSCVRRLNSDSAAQP